MFNSYVKKCFDIIKYGVLREMEEIGLFTLKTLLYLHLQHTTTLLERTNALYRGPTLFGKLYSNAIEIN